jgi:hypothetical protein
VAKEIQMMITYEDLERWGACGRKDGERYSREALDARLGAGWSLTLVEVLRMDWVPAEDREWVAVQDGVLTEEQATAWHDVVVTRAVRTHALQCGVPAVERWAAAWLSGEDRSAARAEAARAAARAARAARAEAAVAEAAVAAAWAAEWAARAARAERERQVRDLLGVLMGDGTS